MIRKHQHVTYRALEGAGPTISAIVRCAHKDGTATVEARFVLDGDGNKIVPGYLGYRYRIDQAVLTPVCP